MVVAWVNKGHNLQWGTRTDSNGNDPEMVNGTTAQIYDADIPPKETTATTKVLAKTPSEDEVKNILWP